MMIQTIPYKTKALRAQLVKIGGRQFAIEDAATMTRLTITVADLKGATSSIHLMLDMGEAGDEIAQAIVDAIENHPGKGSVDDAEAKADA